ncbi:DUF421 domain-containing protein [Terribacillus saccharophilus]|uniref:DUF421 domain-containing protein n=1 Tax=Terribacillus saccharophilus TaxID=361277 RepID=A0ABX4GUX3_9BACI|nr:DUF421 domain-containing protein [Terribacillus saccharophilus]PAD34345.1 DUF421 domain-containing protein [Terribacillus saccharophilus]PAD94923.1 DUF421 domain-containing protein [Terribacillus saccharophilus]PAD98672.1 DUF421 domain-containing protein [Terribacillus saccharophilus]
MSELIHDNLIVIARIITIIPLMLVVTLYMGKRAIGEMPVFDFLIVVILGALVGADIADPEIEHLPTAVAIVAIGLFQKAIVKWKISNRKIGKVLTLGPTIVIQDGTLLYENMRKVQYSIDNILFMLRQKDVFDVRDVETAIVEPNGTLSVLKKPNKLPATREDLNLQQQTSAIAFPVISDGYIHHDTLTHFNLDEEWLRKQLADQNIIGMNQIFFASISHPQSLHISLKERKPNIPPIKH